VPAQLDHGG